MRHNTRAKCILPALVVAVLHPGCGFSRRIVVTRDELSRIPDHGRLLLRTGDGSAAEVELKGVKPTGAVGLTLTRYRFHAGSWLRAPPAAFSQVLQRWEQRPGWTEAEVFFEADEAAGTAWVVGAAIVGSLLAGLAGYYAAQCDPPHSHECDGTQVIAPVTAMLAGAGGFGLGVLLGWGLHEGLTAPSYRLDPGQTARKRSR